MKKSDIIVYIPNDAHRMACSHPGWLSFRKTAIPEWGMVDIADGRGVCPICGCKFICADNRAADTNLPATIDPYENPETRYEKTENHRI